MQPLRRTASALSDRVSGSADARRRGLRHLPGPGRLGAAHDGHHQAVQVFRKVRKENEVLFISGQCADAELAADIQSAAGKDPSVIFQNRYLPDAELVRSFAAADAVLINQSATLNSGTLLLALSMNRPTIAPAKGSIIELAESVGAGWISTFSGEIGRDALRNCLNAIQGHDRGGQAPLDRFDPEAVSRGTMAVLAQILATRRSTNSDVTPSAAPESVKKSNATGKDTAAPNAAIDAP